MTKKSFEKLNLTDPTANLNVRSGTHTQQTARIMLHFENIAKAKTDPVIMPNDSARRSPLVSIKNL